MNMNDCRSNRAPKVGLAFEIEKNQEKKYDTEEASGTPGHIVDWINKMLGEEPAYKPFPGADWKSICTHLRDGVFLCMLVNKLNKIGGQPTVGFQKKVSSPFVAMTNIETFNKAAEAYGLQKEALFQSGDLWEVRKGPMINVINALHSLGFVANSKQVMPTYLGEIVKTIDRE